VADKLMAHVDLCSGIGGFALGFEWAGLSKPVLFCDIELWSRKVLAKHWPNVPIATDVKELADDPTPIIHAIGDRPSILTAGYPCQPFSQAGQRRGSEDDRHIWPEIFTIIQKVRPDWVVCENVSGHITMGLDEVLSDLADKADYAVQTFHLGAVSVDAPHRRMRLWIVARNVANANSLNRWAVQKPQGRRKENPIKRQSSSNSSCDVADTNSKQRRRKACRKLDRQEWQNTETKRKSLQPKNRKAHSSHAQQSSEDVADTSSARLEDDGRRGELGRERDRRRVPTQSSGEKRSNTWKPEPPVGRVANGIPKRVDRLKGLGNAIVPQIAMRIGQTIKAVNDG
tara:strand:- start:115 stop:1140 length:1026 start_codon:yes stop_codon:yes gene_type:complete